MRLWKAALVPIMVVAIAAVSATNLVRAQAPKADIEQFLDDALPASGAPGVAYAVVEQGAITSGARGEELAGSGVQIIADTPFVIGSVSKSFTALAIMQLVEAGAVELDAPVSTYLPEFAGQEAGPVTIRQLLSHTSGYSTVQGNTAHRDETAQEDALAQQVARDALTAPAGAPGIAFAYSNINYRILGRVVEVVSGRSYADYIEREILTTLGMASSFVSDGEVHPEMAVGHRPWFLGKQPFEPGRTHSVNAPAGGVVASAADMAKYLSMMINGQDDLVRAETKALMMSPASDASPNYGFGWNLVAGGATVYHTGTSPGVETQATLIPEEGLAAIMLVNAGSGMGFGETEPLIGGLTGLALGYDYAPAGGAFWRQFMLVSLVLAPVLFVICIIWAFRHREQLRAKSASKAGRASLFVPLVMMAVMGVVLLWLVPSLFGTTLSSLQLYLPDMVLAMKATVVTGVLWALVRIGLSFGGSLETAIKEQVAIEDRN